MTVMVSLQEAFYVTCVFMRNARLIF